MLFVRNTPSVEQLLQPLIKDIPGKPPKRTIILNTIMFVFCCQDVLSEGPNNSIDLSWGLTIDAGASTE